MQAFTYSKDSISSIFLLEKSLKNLLFPLVISCRSIAPREDDCADFECIWIQSDGVITHVKIKGCCKVKPSIFCNTALKFGIGKGFLINLLSTSRISLRKCTFSFFFGTMKDGNAHSEQCCRSSTPSLNCLSTSLMRTSLCIFGTGKAMGNLGHDMVMHLLSIERRPAQFSSHLMCRQRAARILRGAAVTFSDGRHLDACNCSSQLTQDLFCIFGI